MDRDAGVAARHRRAGQAVLGEAFRVVGAVALLGLGECGGEVDVGGTDLGHRRSDKHDRCFGGQRITAAGVWRISASSPPRSGDWCGAALLNEISNITCP